MSSAQVSREDHENLNCQVMNDVCTDKSPRVSPMFLGLSQLCKCIQFGNKLPNSECNLNYQNVQIFHYLLLQLIS
jgi:hypothetical protein